MTDQTRHPDRGPCRRTLCRHPETAHNHDRDGDDCGPCGRRTCPTYLPPSRRPCARCGTPGTHHSALTATELLAVASPGICPWWTPRQPAITRALQWALMLRDTPRR